MVLFGTLLSLASSGAVAGVTPDAQTRQPPDRAPSTMTSKEIASFNAGLDGKDRYYIRCRKEEVIGSLAKKLRICRTNEEWARYSVIGNQNARDTVEAMARAPVNSN
jgi:hypothetical protein